MPQSCLLSRIPILFLSLRYTYLGERKRGNVFPEWRVSPERLSGSLPSHLWDPPVRKSVLGFLFFCLQSGVETGVVGGELVVFDFLVHCVGSAQSQNTQSVEGDPLLAELMAKIKVFEDPGKGCPTSCLNDALFAIDAERLDASALKTAVARLDPNTTGTACASIYFTCSPRETCARGQSLLSRASLSSVISFSLRSVLRERRFSRVSRLSNCQLSHRAQGTSPPTTFSSGFETHPQNPRSSSRSCTPAWSPESRTRARPRARGDTTRSFALIGRPRIRTGRHAGRRPSRRASIVVVHKFYKLEAVPVAVHKGSPGGTRLMYTGILQRPTFISKFSSYSIH